METIEQFEQNTQILEVTEDAKNYLKSVASWSKFFSILAFIGVAFLVFGGFMMFTVKIAVSDMNYDVPCSIFGYIGFFYMNLGRSYVFPCYACHSTITQTDELIKFRILLSQYQ